MSNFDEWAKQKIPLLLDMASRDTETSDAAFDAKTQVDAMRYGWDAALESKATFLETCSNYAECFCTNNKDEHCMYCLEPKAAHLDYLRLEAKNKWAKLWKESAKFYRVFARFALQTGQMHQSARFKVQNECEELKKKIQAMKNAMGEEWPLLSGYEQTNDELWRHCPECREWKTHPLKEFVGHKPDCGRGRFFAIN